MTKYEIYVDVFMRVFGRKADEVTELKYQGIDEWDSVGHMELVSELEDAFDFEFETDDIIDFSSFDKGIEILNTKYDVGIEK